MDDSRVPVLVVDDNPEFLRVARAILEGEQPPFSVYTVQTGTRALDFLDRRPPFAGAPRPAFIVLDFRLPDMNAPVILSRLRDREEFRSIPVLVVSQAAWEEDEATARAAGALQFRVKPPRVQKLRDEILTFYKEYGYGREPTADRR